MTELSIRPFRVEIPQADIDDLKARLAQTRWPAQIPGQEWAKGVPVSYLQGLADYWANEFDWRAIETKINAYPQFVTEIDGQNFHFLHVRSDREDALPLLLCHGWPGSFIEFIDIIESLINPAAGQAFHVVVPSLPGFGFSMPLAESKWTSSPVVGAALATLMSALGYARYGVQGGDFGAFVAPDVARAAGDAVIGVHVNAASYGFIPMGEVSEAELATFTDVEKQRLARLANWHADMSAYFQIQATRPQTLSFGLSDSPVGQLAWIVEKFKEWTNQGKGELPEDKVDRDHMLADVSIYWFTGTGTTSANMYWESMHATSWPQPTQVPVGVATFAEDVSIRRYAEQSYNIVHWSDIDEGGHFAAMEAPELFVADVRTFFENL